jgi:hypothetical protein
METQVTCFARHRYPAEAPPSCGTVESLGTPESWRRTSAATAVLMAALLPTAVVSDMQLRVGIASALLVLASHLAREIRLTTLAIYPEFAQLPDLVRKRSRLVSARIRRARSRDLRRTAASTQPSSRFDTAPVLHDRVAAVRSELLAVATALERRSRSRRTISERAGMTQRSRTRLSHKHHTREKACAPWIVE